VKFPRIVTHLFADGGRIVKTTRTDYTEASREAGHGLGRARHDERTAQGMFAALRGGDMDPLLENVCGPLDPPGQSRRRASAGPHLQERPRDGPRRGRAAAKVPAPPADVPAPAAPAAALVPPAPVADAQAVIESMKSLRDSEESPRRPPPAVESEPAQANASVAPPPPKPSTSTSRRWTKICPSLRAWCVTQRSASAQEQPGAAQIAPADPGASARRP